MLRSKCKVSWEDNLFVIVFGPLLTAKSFTLKWGNDPHEFWVQFSLYSIMRTFCWHLVISRFPPDTELCRAGCLEFGELGAGYQGGGLSQCRWREEHDVKQGNYSHCWKAQGVEDCRQEWGSVLPALRKNSTLQLKHQLETVRLFLKQKNSIYRSRLLLLGSIWRQYVKESLRVTCNFFQPSLTRIKNSVLSLR